MEKLEYYMQIDYPVHLTPISQEDGGGWLAEIPLLKGCMSDGETTEEAILNLTNAKEEWILAAIKRNQTIPIPLSADKGEEYSGKLTFRMPKTLHRQLSYAAKEEDISLNQYILSIISYNFGQQNFGLKEPKPAVSVHNHNTFVLQDKPNRKYTDLTALNLESIQEQGWGRKDEVKRW